MATVRRCAVCGAELGSDAPQGVCPKCLLQRGVRTPSDLLSSSEEAKTLLESERTQIDRRTSDTRRSPADSAPRTPQSALGKVRYFGDYELLEEIARGGMGVVYKARQVSLNRIVAVKMILAGQLASEAEVKRFHTEAEAAANLQHPNIVAIHEVGEHEGQHYFSMDYVEGKHLAELVRENPLSAGRAAQLLKTIAEAIHYAHQRGTLHRDLKPQNVLIDPADQPRITDFGLAKQIDRESGLTLTGAVMGSPAYMPPEQAQGRNDLVGPSSDVYSLGAILYHLVTGRAPFTADSPVATLRKVMEEEPVAPSKLNPKTLPDLETICLKCLEKRPERRYASARELAEELGRFLNQEPIRARRANPVRRVWSWFIRHPWIVTGAASLVVLLTVGFAYRMWERVDALEWRAAHPTENPPFNSDYFLPVWFNFLLFFEFFFLQGVPVSSFLTLRARQQRGNWFYYVFALVGAGQLVFGLEILRRAVATQAWEPQFIVGPILASIAALTNVWFGSALAWKALREARLDLPGLAASEEPIEHPLTFTNQKAITNAIALELFGGIALVIVVAIVMEGSESGNDPRIGFFLGSFGMCGMTWLVLICHLIARSRGLERQSLLPFLLVAVAIAAIGLGGLASPAWYAPLGYYILGFCVGKLLLKRCPLQRGGVAIKAEKRQLLLFQRLRLFIWRKKTAYIAAGFVALVALFYLVENWRGIHAWNQAKARLEKRGEKVEWAAFAPKSRVADDQNVFKHPFMQEYAVRQGLKTKELNWFDPGFIGHGLEVGRPISVATLKKLPRQPEETATFASLAPKLPKAETVSDISFSNAPLADVVQSLARQAVIQLTVESEKEPFITRPHWNVAANQWVSTNQPKVVSFKSTNATLTAALEVLLKEHHLQPELDAATGSYRLKSIYTSLAELMVRLTRDEAQLRQLEEAIQRPHAQLDWTEQTLFLEVPMLNFGLLRTAAQGLATRCKIRLLQGHPDDALRDLMLIKRIADFAPSQPSLVGAMIKTAIEGLLVELLEESLVDGLWPATHLTSVQKEFAEVDLLTPWSTAMQVERAFVFEAIRRLESPWKYSKHGSDFLRMFKMQSLPAVQTDPTFPDKLFATAMLVPPRGWFYQNMVQVAEKHALITALDPARQRVDSGKVKDLGAQMDEWVKGRSPYKILALIAVPNFNKSLTVTAKNQTLVNAAFVACALERHRAAKGSYPEKLEALVPEFAAKLPHDIFNGQPLRYRRTDDGKYLLYSVGWNSKDDGGTMEQPKDAQSKANWSDDHGDWVWQGVPNQR